jgi:hypothetical protein
LWFTSKKPLVSLGHFNLNLSWCSGFVVYQQKAAGEPKHHRQPLCQEYGFVVYQQKAAGEPAVH